MVEIPLPTDPTLEAADAVIEDIENAIPERPYLGISAIGDPCSRKLWYSFRHAKAKDKKAKLIKAAEDGHHGEQLQADRLNEVDGVMCQTTNPSTGKQFEYSWFNGHMRGHPDGKISGLLQAPNTTHIWEHKQCNQKKYDELTKCIEKYGEKGALKEWDITYYGQAILYMFFEGLTRHYLTVSTPGGRATQSCRTESNEKYALELLDKAEKIIFSDEAPKRLSESPSWFYCNSFCDYYDICHQKATPQVNCRTCLHSTPKREGGWSCSKLKEPVDKIMICGGEKHLFLPDMLGSKAIDANENSVTYADGRVNYEGGRVE